ncbi:MAG TPA: hypothetical protein VMF51_08370 [Nocardioides sp.]|uniref:hypothetical protein n=1 Tax=Nocardioides sp. TaxID=35761 RepID=UPI002CC9A1AB|nr:hypothetical protein [Nocardioides sp.]HTW15130.1 hypothetical protein [Nocardioides sp.]
MAGQSFTTTDRLRLEVQRDPAPGELVNLVQNTDGELGGWGYLTPVPGTTLVRNGTVVPVLEYQSTTTSGASYFTTEDLPVVPGRYVGGRFRRVTGGSGNFWCRARFTFVDDDGAEVSSGPLTTITAATGGTTLVPAALVPAGAVAVRLRYNLYGSSAGSNPTSAGTVRLDRVAVVQAATSTGADPATIPLDAAAAYFTNILGPTHEITIDRAELNVGVLNATILDASLAPDQNTLLRPGRKVRLMVLPDGLDWRPLFVGTTTKARADYSLNGSGEHRARITVEAVDAVSTLANVTRPSGVATIAELPDILEGCGVPWSVNGSGNQVPAATVVATNENAKALDQVAITRDTALGYAWVDSRGVLAVWDRASLPTAVAATLTEDTYLADAGSSFDSEQCINEVRVKFLRKNAATLDTVEVPYGPYRDDNSIRQWGIRSKEFTIQGAVDNPAAIAAYAQAILDANATPRIRVSSITLPITQVSHLVPGRALLDLYDRVQVTQNTIVDDTRITGVKHTISAGPTSAECKWRVTLAFAAEGGVAQPQQAPPLPSSPTLRNHAYGEHTGTTNASGAVTFTHGLGQVPTFCVTQNTDSARYTAPGPLTTYATATTVTVFTRALATGAVVPTGTSVTFTWEVRA